MAQFAYETRLDCPPDVLFEFLLKPANVARVADPSTGLQIIEGPDVVTVGSRIRFQLVTYGQIQKMVHEIIAVDRPNLVVEKQIEGPTRAWEHRHLFQPAGDGVLMIDEIEFEPPGGVLGFIATPARICDSLEENFFARQRTLEQLVASGGLLG
ncbi:MAG: SRPBCC family protein [Planctomycetaceae bacterium]